MTTNKKTRQFDMLGQEVFIGDYVVLSGSGGILKIGIVNNFSPKGITMRIGGNRPYKMNRPVCKVVKCGQEIIKSFLIKEKLNQLSD